MMMMKTMMMRDEERERKRERVEIDEITYTSLPVLPPPILTPATL